jgi:signal transduction histidine kinase
MGLGLTISKMILQELKGDIEVHSEAGQGSQFTFRIPIK